MSASLKYLSGLVLAILIHGQLLAHSAVENNVAIYFSSLSLLNGQYPSGLKQITYYSTSSFYYDFIFQLGFVFVNFMNLLMFVCELPSIWITNLMLLFGFFAWFIGNLAGFIPFPNEPFNTIFDIQSFYSKYVFINTIPITFFGSTAYWYSFNVTLKNITSFSLDFLNYKSTKNMISKWNWVYILFFYIGTPVYTMCLASYHLLNGESFQTLYLLSTTLSFVPLLLCLVSLFDDPAYSYVVNINSSEFLEMYKQPYKNTNFSLFKTLFHYLSVFFHGIVFYFVLYQRYQQNVSDPNTTINLILIFSLGSIIGIIVMLWLVYSTQLHVDKPKEMKALLITFSIAANILVAVCYTSWYFINGTHIAIQYTHMFAFGLCLLPANIMTFIKLNVFIVHYNSNYGNGSKFNKLVHNFITSLVLLVGPWVLKYIYSNNDYGPMLVYLIGFSWACVFFEFLFLIYYLYFDKKI